MAGLKKIHAWFSLDIKPKCTLWWKHRQSGGKSSNSSVGPVNSCPDGSWRIAGCPMMRKEIPADGVVLIASLTPCSLWLTLGKNAFVCLDDLFAPGSVVTPSPLHFFLSPLASCPPPSATNPWASKVGFPPAQCSLRRSGNRNSSCPSRWWGWRYLENAFWDISCSPLPSSFPNSIQFQEN